jgi:outer membrane receptor protein involved in Fe transport
LTPGVAFSPGNNLIAIRGISSSAGAATTGVYLDDTPVHVRQFGTGPTAGMPAIFDIERIEILRGPQGTLYGAGSQGGTVRFITPQPDLHTYSAYARGEMSLTESGDPTYEAGYAAGGPLVEDKLAFRASVYNRRTGGWVDWLDYNTGKVQAANINTTNTLAARAAFAWQPISGLIITPSVFHQVLKGQGSESVTQAWSDFDRHQFDYTNPVLASNDDRITLPSLKLEYSFKDYLLVSNTAYYKRDQFSLNDSGIWRLSNIQYNYGFPLLTPFGPDDAVGVPDFKGPGHIVNAQDNWSQEVRLQSNNPDSRFTWVAGVYFSKAKQHNVERGLSGINVRTGESDYDRLYMKLFGKTVLETFGFPLFEGVYSYISDTWVDEEQRAAFADVTWNISDKFSLSAGARYAKVKFSFEAGRASSTQATWTYNGGESNETAVTPRFNVTYKPMTDLMLYANVGKGFRGGGANSSSIINRCADYIAAMGLGDVSQYKSDSVWSYDAGIKGRALRGRFAYDAGVYVIDWTGIQQSNSLVGCGLSYIGNFGSARAKGFDLMVQAMPTDHLLLDLSLGYLNSEYLSQVKASKADTARTLINKGNSLPNVTPWKVALAATYDYNIFAKSGYTRLGYEYGSEQTGTIPGMDPGTTQYNFVTIQRPATNMVRLRSGIRFGEGLDVSVFIDNLLDSAPLLSRSSSSQSTYYQVTTFQPRTGGVTVVYRY